VSPTDRPRRRRRHCNTRAAIITFKVTDFAAAHLNLPIEVIHADDFIMDMVDLNEKRAVAAFRELRTRQEESSVGGARADSAIQRLRNGGFVQTSSWLNTEDVIALI
jgi:hypothetical protein